MSYRNYNSWKYSTYSSPKFGSSSTSREDGPGEKSTTPAPRFCSINPSTYRPTYAGGTYRSVPPKKQETSLPGSRYLKESPKPEEKKVVSKLESYLSKKNSPPGPSSSTTNLSKFGSTKELNSEPKRSPYKYNSSSTTNLTSISTDSKPIRSYTSSATSKDLLAEKSKPVKYSSTTDISRVSSSPKSRLEQQKSEPKSTGPPITYNTRYGGSKLNLDKEGSSRISSQFSKLSLNNQTAKRTDDSPKSITKTKPEGPPITYNSIYNRNKDRLSRSRDPSPASNVRPSIILNRSRSRDPSPVTHLSRETSPVDHVKSRFGGTTSGYSQANSYTNRFRKATSPYNVKLGSSSPSVSDSSMLLSYMTHSEASSAAKRLQSHKKESSVDRNTNLEELKNLANDIEKILKVEVEEVVMVQVTVVHRATSPNPQQNLNRARRLDIAKTTEKTIERPLKKPPTSDKGIQSDRTDDSTKYSRFSSTSNRSASVPWSSMMESKIGGNKVSPDGKDKKDSPSITPNSTRSNSLTKSNSIKSLSKTDKSKSSPKSDSPKKSIQSTTKSQSTENSKSLPPVGPVKAESPAKVVTSINWANKDFRKSALNMGPADRPRKGRSSLSPSDSSVKSGITCNHHVRSERSQSVGSETSSSSIFTATSGSEEETRKTPSKTTKSKISRLTSSRTSLLASSAEELPMDKPVQSNTLKSTSPSLLLSTIEDATGEETIYIEDEDDDDSGTKNEARTPSSTSVVRGLSAVAKIFYKSVSPQRPQPLPSSEVEEKSKTKIAPLISGESTSISESLKLDSEPLRVGSVQENLTSESEGIWWEKKSTSDQPLELMSEMKYKIRHIDSGDRAWWMNSDTTDEKHVSNGCVNEKPNMFKTRIEEPGGKGPRIGNSDNRENTPTNNTNEISYNENSGSKYKIRHIQSGEKAWWMSPTPEKKSVQLPAEQSSQKEVNSKYKIRHIESGEKAWWMKSDSEASAANQVVSNRSSEETQPKYSIRPIESGERAWWLNSESPSKKSTPKPDNISEEEDEEDEEFDQVIGPLGDRASPEGVEDPSKCSSSQNQDRRSSSPYDNVPIANELKAGPHFISRHTNIDEVLGGSALHNARENLESLMWNGDGKGANPRNVGGQQTTKKLDDAVLQIYKDEDYGVYLDLESSLAEQAEEIEGLQSNRKNSLVVRTQLSVRVHAIIEKLLSTEGRDLRRTLSSLKQIFQDDKDLVHGFVAMGGLNCLVQLGSGADQNYQNYILRALGQVMLYVDGMNGVMKNGPTVQWLYSLIASKYRLVVKTSLKLLLVFVEYAESNCYLLVKAIHAVDAAKNEPHWSNIMRLLKDYDNADTELLIYATSLINKTLSGLSDQDSFYDESDYLEQQGMEGVIQRYMSRPGTDLDLLDQLQLYEAVLKFEDGETDGVRIPDNSVRKTLRYRATGSETTERRKSRRHSTGTAPSTPPPLPKSMPPPPIPPHLSPFNGAQALQQNGDGEDSSSSQNSADFNGVFRECRDKVPREGAGVTPGLRRRRERAERQKSFMREQQEAVASGLRFNQDDTDPDSDTNDDKKLLLQLKRDHTVKDLTQKLNNLPMSPQEDKVQGAILSNGQAQNGSRMGDMSGLISKAKEGLAKSKSRGDISRSPSADHELKKQVSPEPKKSENEVHWEELVRNMTRPLNLCDLDFTDLTSDDEKDVLAPRSLGGMIPPPPPPLGIPSPNPMLGPPPPMKTIPPPLFPNNPNFSLALNSNGSGQKSMDNQSAIKKNKKTVKLFWKEVRDDMIPVTIGQTIWDELPNAVVDTEKLEHLFESRAKDLMTKEKQQELNKNKEIIVLDHKRSNAINIAMTKLPPPRAIKAAILKMDATVVTREGIDKLLNMLPTEEERGKIQEAQMMNPELPLGNAEQFLLTLSSISELSARLKLWAFKLDFEISEKEIAEPLMDLKQGLESLKKNKTFKCILATLLKIGTFLNGASVKGFQVEYLAKVPEVKDTVHKHSLLHHLCHMVMETSPETSDLYSEIGPITRASKADFSDIAHNISQLESECKASWDRLKLIAKHDCPPQLKQKLVEFLADCAERIIILDIVHRRVINRYRKFILWLGVPQHRVPESKPNDFCRIISEFALEYRTTRERVQQQIEKKANHRERNKTRGKMIIDVGKFKTQEDRADAELRQLLASPLTITNQMGMDSPDSGTFSWRRRRPESFRSPMLSRDEQFTDGDDEILESLVKTATKAPGTRATPRERKRTRNADRKSLKRSRTREGFPVERTSPSPTHV